MAVAINWASKPLESHSPFVREGFKPATSANAAAVVTEAKPAVNKINVSPNPVKDILSIRLQEPGNYQMRITDVFGKTVLSASVSDIANVNVSKISPVIILSK